MYHVLNRENSVARLCFLLSFLVVAPFLQVLEHPQNVIYGRVIRGNISLTEASRGKKLEDGSIQKPDVALCSRLWLGLQNEVCALLDSTTGILLTNHMFFAITLRNMLDLVCGEVLILFFANHQASFVKKFSNVNQVPL